MPKKIGPYILLFALMLVLIFIIGVRYGQNVEKTNKTINAYLLSITPKPSPTTIPLQFKTYHSKTCGISFLYPDSLTKEKETSLSARFDEDKNPVLEFECEKNNYLTPTAATADSQTAILTKINTKNGKRIIFTISRSLQPLIEKSLEFSN